jgi:hypothetical protein
MCILTRREASDHLKIGCVQELRCQLLLVELLVSRPKLRFALP